MSHKVLLLSLFFHIELYHILNYNLRMEEKSKMIVKIPLISV